MLRHAMAACLALLPLIPTGAVANEVTEFTLDNGLHAVVIEDHRAPVVVHMLWYRVGAADEPPGRSGIAHFLEHLMFKATETLESGEFSDTVEANGGSDNAFTSWDYTGYYQRVASDRLGLMMQMEADRMRNLLLTDDDIATERSVILEERAQRTDSSAGALFNEQLRASLYLAHPYRIPIGGWRHEIEALDREDVFSFYHDYYSPDNAILIVAGDVTPEEVRELAEEHYGPLEPSGIEPRQRPHDPPQIADRRIYYEDPRVSDPYVVRSYIAPERDPGDQRTAAALTLLSNVLAGSGATAVLPRVLQVEEARSLYASASYSGTNLDDTAFSIFNVPVPGVSLEEAEADLDRVIAQFLEDGIDPEQFARIQFQWEAEMIYAQDDVGDLARMYGVGLTSGLTVQDIQDWPDVIASITPEEVMEAARMIFTETTSVTGYLTAPGL
ncbi:M16 family metallopeptidase [Nioella ostreopsis]|uniref:M16 family metallopeptidase n=1 Tax=Nioella ostreopsis TaxID=2448479 RepID=UPI000FD92DF2|nr:pitrilysin family protein [Nioella ostreopsis]